VKLLMFIPSLAGGGAERTVVNLVQHLPTEGNTITLVLVRDAVHAHQNHVLLDEIPKHVEVRWIERKMRLRSVAGIALDLTAIVRHHRPAVVFSTRHWANIIAIYAVKRQPRRLRPAIVIRESNHRSAQGLGLFWRCLIRWMYRDADKIIALSHGVAKDLTTRFDVPRNIVNVIHNPVDIEQIECRARTGQLSGTDPFCDLTVISVGRLAAQKDHATLIKAFAIVRQRIKCRLVIVGQGPEEDALRALCARLGRSEDVTFTGFRRNPYPLIQAADLFVLSSRFEGFGHVIAEAMVLNTAVISTDCPSGPSEIITDGEDGMLVSVGCPEEMADVIEGLLNNPRRRRLLADRAKETVERFRSETIAVRYQRAFEETANMARRHRRKDQMNGSQ
jgi:glycosyltransferase involved in cell wall biosynthesis